MPTYEYRCDSCQKNFDVVQAFTDDPLTACPTCGAPVRKVFGSVGIVFKGSGFYKTDSRSGGSSKTAGENGDRSSGAESSTADSSSSSASDGKGTGDAARGSEAPTPSKEPAATTSAGSTSTSVPGSSES